MNRQTYKKQPSHRGGKRSNRRTKQTGVFPIVLVVLTFALLTTALILAIQEKFNWPDRDSSAQTTAVEQTDEGSSSDNLPETSETEVETSETTTEETTEPTVLDNTAPEITGAVDLLAQTGDKISYRTGVTVNDDIDDSVQLQIDSSQVNIKEPGVYPVIYSAEDAAGNSTEIEVKITVIEKTQSQHDPEELFQTADGILAEITTPEMSQIEQAEAIYWWTKQHIAYVNHSDKTSWIDGAWQGINQGSGDCFNYFSVAKLLLTRAGIENQDIIKSTGSHYWSLVNVGDGWYHFDTTPRKAGGEFFMLTDDEIIAYSNQHGNSHVWDRSKYPWTPLE